MNEAITTEKKDSTTFLCPECKAMIFVCANEILHKHSDGVTESIQDGFELKLMTTPEVRTYKYGFSCKCPKFEQLALI